MTASEPGSPDRFKPNASREMASMFDDVSGRYDFLNAVMTLGQDGAWREAMWRRVPAGAHRVLDLCTGSGVSLTGLRRVGRTVLGVDVSLGMLHAAANALAQGGWSPRLACADAFALPLRSHSLDAITIAFGIRNVEQVPSACAEMRRVLKPGGRLAILEFAMPTTPGMGALYRWYVRTVLPRIGRAVSRHTAAYDYLPASIDAFAAPEQFVKLLRQAGFADVQAAPMTLGSVILYTARRGD